jgi:uncharacterized Fe-S cluster-containing radical SAM superfamily protein
MPFYIQLTNTLIMEASKVVHHTQQGKVRSRYVLKMYWKESKHGQDSFFCYRGDDTVEKIYKQTGILFDHQLKALRHIFNTHLYKAKEAVLYDNSKPHEGGKNIMFHVVNGVAVHPIGWDLKSPLYASK